MRKIILLAVLCPAFFMARSQQPLANPFPKTISVSGSAEMEIIPDEIYVNVVLREYQKRGEDKKELETLKNDFLTACKAAGLADSAISIVFYTGYNNYFWLRKKKRTPDLLASITYQVKFSASKQMDDLVDKLDDEATQSFDIVIKCHFISSYWMGIFLLKRRRFSRPYDSMANLPPIVGWIPLTVIAIIVFVLWNEIRKNKQRRQE